MVMIVKKYRFWLFLLLAYTVSWHHHFLHIYSKKTENEEKYLL